jgi:hypothetical protein
MPLALNAGGGSIALSIIFVGQRGTAGERRRAIERRIEPIFIARIH